METFDEPVDEHSIGYTMLNEIFDGVVWSHSPINFCPLTLRNISPNEVINFDGMKELFFAECS